jgi:hypothetical protein
VIRVRIFSLTRSGKRSDNILPNAVSSEYPKNVGLIESPHV